ncbi:MAG: transposase, partial [Bacteroidota bacterium]
IDGIELITGIRNNMKNILMEMQDKILLRKRSVIETVNDELKNICQVEYSRYRSFNNFITNLLAAIATYFFFPIKPTIRFNNDSRKELGLIY